MKHIVALACSPTKAGNSDTLLDEFIAGIKSTKANIKIDKVYLCDVPAHSYDHPHKTVNETEEPEFFALCEKVQKADALIIATPTFNFNVPSRLKNFIDRIGYFALDYKTINAVGQPTGQLGKFKIFTIVTGGTPAFHRRFLFFLYPGFWLWAIFGYYGCWNYRTAYAGPLMFSNPAKNQPKLLAKFKRFGAKFAKKVS